MQSYFQWTNKTTEGMRTAKKKFAVCHKSLGLWHFRLPKCLNGQDLFGHNEWHMSSNASSILPPLLFSDTQNKIKKKLLSISIVIGIEIYSKSFTNCYVIFFILFLLHFLIFLNIHCIILVFICTTMDIKQTKKYSATFFWYHYYISYPFNTWIAYKQLLLLCPQHKKTWLIITVISFANRICVPTLVTIQILTNVQFNYNFYVLPVFL